jgi:DNA polymerase
LAPIKSWWEILRDVGYPQDVIVLDWEAYFDEEYGLTKQTVPEFVNDKRWEEIALGHFHATGYAPYIDADVFTVVEIGPNAISTYLRYIQGQYGPNFEEVTIVIQNAPFDASILAWRHGIYPRYIIDTTCLARAYHTRSKHGLGPLCEKFGLPAKGETTDFLGATLRPGRYFPPRGRNKFKQAPIPRPLMTDDLITKMVGYCSNDVAREWDVFKILLPKLTNPKVELAIQDTTLRLFTQPRLVCDLELGAELVVKMASRMEGTLPAGVTAEEVSGNHSFDSLLTTAIEAAGDRPGLYQKAMKKGWAYGLAKDDPELKALLAHPSERVRALIKARVAIKSWPLHISRVQSIMSMARACGGLMPVPLKYHGAHPGRDSGAEGINLQNMPKRGEPEILAIRGLLKAPDGDELVIVDKATIEARVLAYLAGQTDLVEAFTNKADVYCKFASIVLGWPVRKARKDDPAPIAKKCREGRALGKVGVLGCGYGMGWERLIEYASGPGYDLKLVEADARKIVDTYRQSNPMITGFWRAIEKAFIYTARYQANCEMPRGISFHSTKDVDVVMRLPNGRCMNYHRVKLEAGEYGQMRASVWNEIEHHHDHLWGGVLTENVVQAVSRDLLMEAMLRLEAKGHHIVHRIHDELVILAKKGEGHVVLKEAEREFRTAPVWAPGLPLDAEGCVSDRYGLH